MGPDVLLTFTVQLAAAEVQAMHNLPPPPYARVPSGYMAADTVFTSTSGSQHGVVSPQAFRTAGGDFLMSQAQRRPVRGHRPKQSPAPSSGTKRPRPWNGSSQSPSFLHAVPSTSREYVTLPAAETHARARRRRRP
jgi:hypothetical protein